MLLEEETFKEYGYYPSNLTHGSQKKIIVRCDYCKDIYTTNKNNLYSNNKNSIKNACTNCRAIKSIEYRPNGWTTEEDMIIKSLYGTTKAKNILLQNRNYDNIIKRANKLGLKSKHIITSRQNSRNSLFFNHINIDSAYIAGLIASDGCISKDYISFSSIDRELVDVVQKQLMYTGNTYVRNNTKKISYELSIKDQTIVNDLNNIWNITPKKSLSLKPPNISLDEHILSYIIGYIDGDGWIWKSKRGHIQLGYCGTYNIVKWISNYLYISNTIYKNKHAKHNFSCTISGKNAYPVLKRLYGIQTPYKISRKWDLAKELINKYEYKDIKDEK